MIQNHLHIFSSLFFIILSDLYIHVMSIGSSRLMVWISEWLSMFAQNERSHSSRSLFGMLWNVVCKVRSSRCTAVHYMRRYNKYVKQSRKKEIKKNWKSTKTRKWKIALDASLKFKRVKSYCIRAVSALQRILKHQTIVDILLLVCIATNKNVKHERSDNVMAKKKK